VSKVTDSLFVHVGATGGDLTMTSTDVRSNAEICMQPDNILALPQQDGGSADFVQALASLGCDLVRVPANVCCGVLDDLTRRTELTPAVLQLGGFVLFFVKAGSAAAVLADGSLATSLAALGLQVSDDVRHLCGPAAFRGAETCWVVPPSDGNPHVEMPSARSVVEAVQAAYAIFGPKEGA
jgi:hypothetical protein